MPTDGASQDDLDWLVEAIGERAKKSRDDAEIAAFWLYMIDEIKSIEDLDGWEESWNA